MEVRADFDHLDAADAEHGLVVDGSSLGGDVEEEGVVGCLWGNVDGDVEGNG